MCPSFAAEDLRNRRSTDIESPNKDRLLDTTFMIKLSHFLYLGRRQYLSTTTA